MNEPVHVGVNVYHTSAPLVNGGLDKEAQVIEPLADEPAVNTIAFEQALLVGMVLTTNDAVLALVVPHTFVASKLYTPACEVVKLLREVFCVDAVKPSGPVQLKDVAPVAIPVNVMVLPSQAGFGLTDAETDVGTVVIVIADETNSAFPLTVGLPHAALVVLLRNQKQPSYTKSKRRLLLPVAKFVPYVGPAVAFLASITKEYVCVWPGNKSLASVLTKWSVHPFHLIPRFISAPLLVHVAVPLFFTVTVTVRLVPVHQEAGPPISALKNKARYCGIVVVAVRAIPLTPQLLVGVTEMVPFCVPTVTCTLFVP